MDQQNVPEAPIDVEVYVHDVDGNRMGTGRWLIHPNDTVIYENVAGEQQPTAIVSAAALRNSSTWRRVPASSSDTPGRWVSVSGDDMPA